MSRNGNAPAVTSNQGAIQNTLYNHSTASRATLFKAGR